MRLRREGCTGKLPKRSLPKLYTSAPAADIRSQQLSSILLATRRRSSKATPYRCSHCQCRIARRTPPFPTAWPSTRSSTSELIAAKVTGPLDGGVLATVSEVQCNPGGVTLSKADRTVIGGRGVSGAPGGDRDEACAQAVVHQYKGEFH